MITKLSVAGEISESKAPSGLARIELVGYSPKKAGQWGSVILVKPKAESGKRFVKTKDMAMDKDFIKPVADFAKLTQTTEGTWVFQIIKPLPAGHYLITFSKNPPGFWDFDVK